MCFSIDKWKTSKRRRQPRRRQRGDQLQYSRGRNQQPRVGFDESPHPGPAHLDRHVLVLFVVLTQGTESLTASGTTFLVDLHSTRLARSAGCSHEFHNNCIGEWARTFAVTRCGFNSMSRVTNHLVRCAKLSSETSNLVHLRSRYKEEAVFDARTFLLSGILGTTNRN